MPESAFIRAIRGCPFLFPSIGNFSRDFSNDWKIRPSPGVSLLF
jgi:hypothetical protein